MNYNRISSIFSRIDNDASSAANIDGTSAANGYHDINMDDQVNSRDAYNSSYDAHLTQLTQTHTFETFENEETNLCGGESSPRAKEGDTHREEWGLLRRRDGKEDIRLLYRTKDGRRDTYSIGRSSKCDVAIKEHKTVSATHCIVYCDYSQARLRVFVEDYSANGTFVNDSLTRLTKGQRLEIKSGDEILLHNPRVNPHKGGTSRDNSNEINEGDEATLNELIAKTSFIFINLRDRVVGQRQVAMAPLNTSEVISPEKIPQAHVEDFYIIGDQIGSGMCGTVHLCVHKDSGEHCAVKIIDTKKFSLAPGLSPLELREEAEMMRNLDHSSIIRIKDTYETDHVIFIVMELMRGGDLFERIVERGRYEESTARAVMGKILSAVEYLHSKEIIHRDLKPENILLVDAHDDTNIKITDFGLAKRTNQEGLKTFCGTPQYFAPEVLKRKGTVTGTGRYGMSADMWSLGVVLYILLSGTFPFEEDNLFDQIQNAEYSVTGSEWSSISESAKHLVKGLMSLRPEHRLNIKQALAHPWMLNIPLAPPPLTPTAYHKSSSSSSVRTRDRKASNGVSSSNSNNNIFGSQQSTINSTTRRGVHAQKCSIARDSVSSNITTSQSQAAADDRSKLSNLWFWSNKQSIIDKVGTGGSASSTHIENLIAKVADTPMYKKSMANRANLTGDNSNSNGNHMFKTMDSEVGRIEGAKDEAKNSKKRKEKNDKNNNNSSNSSNRANKRLRRAGGGMDITDDLMSSRELSDDNIEDCPEDSDDDTREAIASTSSKSSKSAKSPMVTQSTPTISNLATGFTKGLGLGLAKKISVTTSSSLNTNHASNVPPNPNPNLKQGSLEQAWGKAQRTTTIQNRENVSINE